MVKRFYKNKQYIGIRFHDKDSWGEWQNYMSIGKFSGKPYGDYDDVIDFTVTDWENLTRTVQEQAEELGRELRIKADFVAHYPIWL